MLMNKNLFTELYLNIKQQGEKSLINLIENAFEIDQYLQSDLILSNKFENLNRISLTVQNYLRNFLELVEHLSVWLELDIPSYSESDEFRIQIQNEILDEIASIKTQSIVSMGQFSDYREQRALAKKEIFKRSKFDDNFEYISYLDEQFYRNLKLILIEMKSSILRIYNLFKKNKDSIYQQRSVHEHVNNYF